MEWYFYPIGALIGFLGMMAGGFWGVGCGWLVVPTMLIFGFDPLSAVGIGLLQMVPSTALTVIRQAPEIGWGPGSRGRELVIPLAAGAFAASFAGRPLNTILVAKYGGSALQWMLLVFIAAIMIQTLSSRPAEETAENSRPSGPRERAVALTGGVCTGLVSSLLGVGGGIVVRPILISIFRVPEVATGRIVRLLLLVTTATGGVTYLLRAGGVDWPVLGVSMVVAMGGMAGFPLGARLHATVCRAGYAKLAHRSFAVVAVAMLLNTVCHMAGLDGLSRVAMLGIALGLGIWLPWLGRCARRKLAAQQK